LEGNAINITSTNFTELDRLCEEFSFSELSAKLSEFRPSIDFKDTKTLQRITSLEETANQHSHFISILQSKVSQLSTDFGRLVMEVSSLRSVASGIQTLSDEVSSLQTQKPNDPVVEQLSTEFSELRKEVLTLKTKILPILPDPSFDSRILSTEFHHRCDGQANTLTVILDTKGNVFGGFTPVEWESRVYNGKTGKQNNSWKGDESRRSFLFTLKNPHKIGAKKFELKEEMKQKAIFCHFEVGPFFSNDIGVCDNCNEKSNNGTCLGYAYENVTGLDKFVVFTGSENFQVKEIEIFEVMD
jgi:hypothetical protein